MAPINRKDESYINPEWCIECGSCAVFCYENAIQCEGLALESDIFLTYNNSDTFYPILEEREF